MPGMANHASALKAQRQNTKHRNINRSNRSSLRTLLKKFNDQLQQGQAEEARNSLPEVYGAEQYGIAVRKDRPEVLEAINAGLAAIKKNGTYDEIFAKYFGAD